MSEPEQLLFDLAHQLGKALASNRQRLVLAESCTGGIVSTALTDVPGISEFYCGSAVTYRNETKTEWLGANRSWLENPKIGAVSAQIAEQMCLGVLARTPEADLAASVTGHLGPNAPADLDGVIFIAVAFRQDQSASIQRRTLPKIDPGTRTIRYVRQREAAALVLQTVMNALARRNSAN